MSWYNNDEGFARNNPKKTYIRRFWMPRDSDRLITFVDEPVIDLSGVRVQTPFKYNEYQIQLNGNWRNWFTQPFNQDDDVLGQMEYKASKVAALTIVDHAEWEDKNGGKHKDELTLFVVKRSSAVWKQITKLMEREGSLAGKTFRVHRMGDKSPGSGSMLEKHDQNFQLRAEDVPFNYLEVLKPKSKQELEALFHDPFQQNSTQSQAQPQSTVQPWVQQNGNTGWTNPDNGWGNTNHGSWNNPQPQQPPQQPQQGNDRVYGATANNGNGPIPF